MVVTSLFIGLYGTGGEPPVKLKDSYCILNIHFQWNARLYWFLLQFESAKKP